MKSGSTNLKNIESGPTLRFTEACENIDPETPAMLTVQEICQKAQQLPCSPSILPQVVQLLSRDDAGISELESIIKRDPGLSAAVLKMANSAYFSAGQSFDHLSEAILRLGFKQTYRITVSVTGGRWSSFDLGAYGWQPGDFCRHSFAVAVSARLVAEHTSGADPELAYTAGLMHDAGKLALAYASLPSLDAVRRKQQLTRTDWLTAEQAVLGFTHADVTAALLSSWNFPSNLVEVGRHYASPAEADPEYGPLVNTVHAAKHLAIQTGIGAGEDAFWTPLEQDNIRSLGLEESEFQDLLPELVDILQKLLQKEILTGAIRFD